MQSNVNMLGVSDDNAFGRQIFESSPDCVKLLSIEGHVLTMNRNGLCAMELPNLSDVAGQPWKSLWPEGTRDEIDVALAAARQGRTGHFEGFCPTARGTPKWWDVLVTPVYGNSGEIEQILAISRDVSRSHEMLAKLQASEARFRSLIAATSAIVWSDPAGLHFETEQPDWAAFTGQAFDQYKGWGWLEAVHPEDRAHTAEGWKRSLETGALCEIEHRLRRADGQYRYMKARAVPVADAAGAVCEWIGIHTDVTDKKLAEIALHENHARFEKIVAQAATGVVEMDTKGRITLVNQRYCDMLGIGKDELLGIHVLEVTAPSSVPTTVDAVNQLLTGGPDVVIEKQYRRKDGTLMWATSSVNALRGPGGVLQGIVAIVVDITDTKRAEEALRVSEERYRSLVSVTAQMVWTTSPDGPVIEDSPTWRAYTGQSYDEWKGFGWLDAIHPDDRESTARIWAQCVANEKLFETEYRIRRASDGEYRWTLVRALPLLAADGSVREWIGANTDIHEIKMAQAQLSQRLADETRHAVLLGKVAEASRHVHTAMSVDEIARILVEQARELLGVHQAVVSLTVDGNWAQAINAVSLSDRYAAYRTYDAGTDGTGIYAEVCRTNQPMRLTQDELIRHPLWKGFGRHADRHPAMRGWLAVPLVGHNGKNLGLIQASDKYESEFTSEDEAILSQLAAVAATGFENARLYTSLQEQDRRKDEFLAMLAHELRNPLAPIGAAADLLKLVQLDHVRVRQTSEIISRQVRHMTGLIDDLMDVSRVTRGLVKLEKTHLDAKRIVADAVEQVRPLLEARRHRFTVRTSPEPAVVTGDQKRLVQTLTNLLNNAAKYTPEGGEIELSLQVDNRDVSIAVTDNGIGMTPDLVRRAFELFAQGERSSDRTQGGLGIGLALVKSLIEMHGGSVHVESEGLGKGSRFAVVLPRAEDKAANSGSNRREASIGAPEKRLKVMVVDDNADAAKTLAMLVEACGHEVFVEHGSRQAIAAATGVMPDVFLLDVGLPDMDGNKLARHLRSAPETAEAVLVAVTGYGQDHDRTTAFASGFDHHLVKPIDTELLIQLLNDADGVERQGATRPPL